MGKEAFIYLIFFTIWIIRLYYKLYDEKTKKYILFIGFLIIFWMLIRIFKDIIDNLVLIYRAIRWPLTFLMIFFSVKLIYVLAPSVKVKGSDTTIGAFITTIGWILFTLIFGYYIKYFSKYDIIYGGLSSITVLLIWIYALCFILVLGIVINTLKYNK